MNFRYMQLALASLSVLVFLWAPPAGSEPAADDEFKVLGKTLWVIMTRAAEGARPDEGALQEHMEHQFRLENEGIMFGAGPLFGADGNPVGGMIIIRATNREEAVRIADSDPMHARGLRTYTLHEWMLNEGHLTITLDYSRGTFTLD